MTFTKVESFAKIYFKECVNEEDGSRFNHEIIPNKTVCLDLPGGVWVNPYISFDNVGIAYLSLFQIATFKGWMDIMDDAVDSAGVIEYRLINN